MFMSTHAAILMLLRSTGLPTDDIATAPHLDVWVLEAERTLVGVIGMQRFGMSALPE